MGLSILQQPLAFTVLAAVSAAIITWAYTRTIETDEAKVNKAVAKVLVLVLVVVGTLQYLSHQREPISTDPF